MSEQQKHNRMRKVNIVMERFWLVLAILALLFVIYFFIVDGVNSRTLQYLVFPVLAGVMYGFRVTFRKRLERRDNQN